MAMNMNAALKIRADVDGQNKIVALNRGLNSLETTAKGVTGAMRGLTGASAGLSGALGALAPLLSVAGLASLVKGTLDAADNMNDLAQSTGVSVEALSRFNKAAAVSGTNLEGVSKGLVKLNKAMVDAATGGKESAATFQALGVNVKNADGSLKSADRVMLEVANRFKAMPDGAAKTALALRLFGKSGAELVPLLNMGGDAIDKMSTKMTTAFAQKADEYSDKLAVLGGKVRALGMDLTIALLPALDQITDALTVVVSGFNSLPDPLKAAAVGAATLALAWGPLSGVIKGGIGLVATLANGMEILRYQTALAGGVVPLLTGSLQGLRLAILAIPGWGWVLAGVTALGLLGKALYDNNEGFRSWVNNVGTIISTDFQNAMKNVVALGRAAAQGVSNAWQALVGATSSAAAAIGNAFSGPFGFIANAAQQVFGQVQRAIASLWNALPEPIRKALGQAGQMALNASPAGYLVGVGVRAFQMGPQPTVNRAGKADLGADGGLSAFTPDLGALGGSSGGGAKAAAEKAKQQREALAASKSALEQARAELAIERELDPVRKIQLEYAEKRRALMAAVDAELAKQLPKEQEANVQRKRSVDLQKLDVQEKKELADAYKKLGDAAYDAAFKTQFWGSATETTKGALSGFRDGISSYLESIGTLGEGISSLTQSSIKGLEDAIVSLTTTGTFSFRQFALSVVEEMTRMVTRLLIIAPILQAIQSLIPGAGGIGAKFPTGAGLLPKGKLFEGGIFGNGGAFDRNGLQAFAMGGIVNRPTIFPFADGGAGRLGLMGEAGPEAIIPLKRGADGKLGVAGGGGTTVNVSVDARGTSVEGNDTRGNQLARVVAQAVQAELIKQKRPGGLLVT
jgi:lambda family phage tail tape measure protein